MSETSTPISESDGCVPSDVPTLAQWIDVWLASSRGRYEPNTIAGYRSVLHNHVVPHPIGATRLDRLRRRDLRAFARGLLASTGAMNSVRQIWTALSSALEAAALEEIIPANPARGAANGLGLWGTEPVASELALLPDELVAFQAAALLERPPYRWLFTTMAYTPYRIGEAVGFRGDDLDGDAVWVRRTYHGSGRFGRPKFGRERVMDLGPEAADALREAAQAGGHWPFAGKGQRWPIHKVTAGTAFARILARAKLPDHYTPHALRHTWASVMRAGGMDLGYIREQLGHASTATTERIYANHFQVRHPDRAASFGRLLRERHDALRIERVPAAISQRPMRRPR